MKTILLSGMSMRSHQFLEVILLILYAGFTIFLPGSEEQLNSPMLIKRLNEYHKF